MTREHINPAGLFKSPAYTRIVTIDGPAKMVFIAGQTAADANNQCVGKGDYLAQYRHIMESLEIQLKAAGANWDDVVFKRVYTLDVVQYRAAQANTDNPRYWDPDRPPPSTLLGVSQLAQPDYLIEVEILAMVAES